MVERTAKQTVQQAISDFDEIREAIKGHKIDVPYPTPTRVYPSLIAGIREGSITGLIKYSLSGAVLDNSTGGCILGSCVFEENRKILNILYGKVEAIDEEESEI